MAADTDNTKAKLATLSGDPMSMEVRTVILFLGRMGE